MSKISMWTQINLISDRARAERLKKQKQEERKKRNKKKSSK